LRGSKWIGSVGAVGLGGVFDKKDLEVRLRRVFDVMNLEGRLRRVLDEVPFALAGLRRVLDPVHLAICL